MWKAALAGAVALATAGICIASAGEVSADVELSRPAGAYVFTRGDIARFKAAMKLTPEQEQLWPAIDAALRQLAAEQAQNPASAGLVARVGNRISAVVMTAVAVRRVGAAAMPLIRTLDDTQKRDALHFANGVGMGDLARAF